MKPLPTCPVHEHDVSAVGHKGFPLHGNGQPESEGDDFVQDPAPLGQGVPSGTFGLPEVQFLLDLPSVQGYTYFRDRCHGAFLRNKDLPPKQVNNATETGVGSPVTISMICVDSILESHVGTACIEMV